MGFQLASNSELFIYCQKSRCSLLKRSRCSSGWRRVQDADCDGFDVSRLRDEGDRMSPALGYHDVGMNVE